VPREQLLVAPWFVDRYTTLRNRVDAEVAATT
jgi:hypothetical protein